MAEPSQPTDGPESSDLFVAILPDNRLGLHVHRKLSCFDLDEPPLPPSPFEARYTTGSRRCSWTTSLLDDTILPNSETHSRFPHPIESYVSIPIPNTERLDLYINLVLSRHHPVGSLNLIVNDVSSFSSTYTSKEEEEEFDRFSMVCRPMDHLDSVLRFAASRSIKNIQLSFLHPHPWTHYANPSIPESLYLSSHNLVSLELTSLSFPPLPQDNDFHFPLLETLHLRSARFAISDDLARLFSHCCPNLKSLFIDRSLWVPNVTVTPRIFPNLEQFKFINVRDCSQQNIHTEAPKLRLFYFDGGIEKLHLRNCPNLVAAHISSSASGLLSCQRLIQIMEVFVNVEVLVVSYWFFSHFEHWHWQSERVFVCKDRPACDVDTYPVPQFKKLRKFHCHGILLHKLTMRALLLFVCRNPLLDELCINFDFYKPQLPESSEREGLNAEFSLRSSDEMDIMEDYEEEFSWYNEEVRARLEAEKKLLCHSPDVKLKLKTVSVTLFSDDDIHIRLLRFILEKSPELMSLCVTCIQQNHVMDLKQKISSFTCASEAVKINVEEIEVSDYDSKCRGKCSPVDCLWK